MPTHAHLTLRNTDHVTSQLFRKILLKPTDSFGTPEAPTATVRFGLLPQFCMHYFRHLHWGAERVPGLFSGMSPIHTNLFEISMGFVLGRHKSFRHVPGMVQEKYFQVEGHVL